MTHDDDPTDEVEALEEGFSTTQPIEERVVSVHDNSSGQITFDDLGQPRWQWITEAQTSSDPLEATFDHMKALDSASLEIEEDHPKLASSKESGYDPYDTLELKIDRRFFQK